MAALVAAATLPLAAITPTAAFAQALEQAALDRDLFLPADGGWQTYVNGRFGMSLDFPARLLTPSDPPENGDGRRFTAPDAQLETFGWNNVDGETPRSMRERLRSSPGYANVTYERAGNSWLVLSGYRGEQVFYEKYMFRGDTVQAFGLEYAVSARATYDPLVERIEKNFRPG